ncbi:spermatogenesis-associated protein 17 isoform X2, partial [Huso huso]
QVQKRWRTCYVRKYVHNYYALKEYMEGLTMTNEIVMTVLENILLRKSDLTLPKAINIGQINKLTENNKKILANQQNIPTNVDSIAGVFNLPYKLSPNEMEFRLCGANPLSPKASQSRKDVIEGIVETSAPGTPFTLLQIEPLQLIPKKKLHGPIRDPAEVLQQRYKPLEPTLRVATSITSVEEAREELKRKEWGSQVNDELQNRQHELMIHTSSKCGHVDYGTKF